MKDLVKPIKHLQNRNKKIDERHSEMDDDLQSLKDDLNSLLEDGDFYIDEDEQKKQLSLEQANQNNQPIKKHSFDEIVAEAEREVLEDISYGDILTGKELIETDQKINIWVNEFNKKHELDKWDYAIGGACGLFAGLLDLFFVKKPPKPSTTRYNAPVDGVFNKWSKGFFDKYIPPDLSEKLAKHNKIGGADTSTTKSIKGVLEDSFHPTNHRFKALGHDPVLAFFIGVNDVINNTCTILDGGVIKTLPTTSEGIQGIGQQSIFEVIGRMFGHLLSDVNAPSYHKHGPLKGQIKNIGMGIPAPLFTLFGKLNNIKITDYKGDKVPISKIAEYMYVNGYDTRHFLTMSFPVIIMEVLVRACYIIREHVDRERPFFDVIKECLPFNMSPRLRLIMTISYGTSTSVNLAKVYFDPDKRNAILNANYTMWLGFIWNTFFSLKWVLLDKADARQKFVNEETLKELENIQTKIDSLLIRAEALPI